MVLEKFVDTWRLSLSGAPAERLRAYDDRIKQATSADPRELARRWLPRDWLVRVCVPAWLEQAPGPRPHAATLRALAPVRDGASLAATHLALDVAGRVARGVATGVAADVADRYGVRGDVWDASDQALNEAAAQAAIESVWDVAWGVLGGTAHDAALDAARISATAAARDSAVGEARAAADAALAPTATALQDSAFALLDRMIAAARAPTERDAETLRRVTPAAGQEGVDYLSQLVGARVVVQPGGRGMIVQPHGEISPTLSAKLRAALPGSRWDAVPGELPALYWWAPD
jgi:hypothetical protein